MKVGTKDRLPTVRQDGPGSVARTPAASIFSRELSRQEGTLLDTDRLLLADLKERVLAAGDMLEKDPSMANFRTYRELIGQFAKKATAIAYRVDVQTDRLGGRAHDVVVTIDKEVDGLYHLVMGGERNRIQIAAKILSIKGIIVKLSA